MIRKVGLVQAAAHRELGDAAGTDQSPLVSATESMATGDIG